jgi:hypothetical protein
LTVTERSICDKLSHGRKRERNTGMNRERERENGKIGRKGLVKQLPSSDINCNSQNHWLSGLCPSSGIPNN